MVLDDLRSSWNRCRDMRYAEVRYGFAPSTLNSPASRVFAIRNDTGELSVKVGFTPPPMAERSTVTSVSVCLCVFVLDHIFRTTRPSFTNFLYMLPMAVARSSSGIVVISCVLPVFWMTSCLLISLGCSTSPPS